MDTPRKFMGAVAVGLAVTIAGKVLAFLRDVLLSMGFGATQQTDAFFIANFIPALLWSVLFATIGLAFMPMYVEVKRRSEADAMRLANEATIIYAVAALLMTAICILFSGHIVRLTAPHSAGETQALARSFTMIMAVGFVFTGYVAVQNAIQQANDQWLPPLFVPFVNNLAAVIAVLVAIYFEDLTYVIVGAVLIWIVQSPLQRGRTRGFYESALRCGLRHETLAHLTIISLPIMAGVLLDQLTGYVGIALASGFGEGAVSHLSYASRLSLFFSGMFSTLIAYLLFAKIAARASQQEDREVGRLLETGCFVIMALTMPVIMAAFIFRNDLISFVFGRNAFRPDDVRETAEIFGFLAYGVILASLREMLNRVFFSYRKMSIPLIAGIAATSLNVVISIYLSARMGLPGVALGTTISTLIFVVVQTVACSLWKPALMSRSLLIATLVIALASVPTPFALTMLQAEIGDLPVFYRLVIGGLCSMAVFSTGIVLWGYVLGYRWTDSLRIRQ